MFENLFDKAKPFKRQPTRSKAFQLPKSPNEKYRVQRSEEKYARNRANRKRKQANRNRNLGGQFRGSTRKGQG